MSEVTKIISEFKDFSVWVNTLNDLDEKLWSTPISENKWSVGEIIAHIMNWDKHLISVVIPAVKTGKGIEFPSFDSFNKLASDYALSGVSKAQLIVETIETRELLVKELLEMSVEDLTRPNTANGISHCPHTGEPYSLIYIIKEFIDHDLHHKSQIKEFLR